MTEHVLEASTSELIDTFRGALIAFLLSADRIDLRHDDFDASPTWEKLTQQVFDAFVRQPIDADRLAPAGAHRLANYDIDYDDFSQKSWIAVEDCAFVRFLTVDEPFGTAQIVHVDPVTKQAGQRRNGPASNLVAAVVRHYSFGAMVLATTVEAID